MNKPLWATPERTAHLAELVARHYPQLTEAFYQNLDRVVFGEMSMSELMDDFTKRICREQVEYWKADDREARSYLLKLAKRYLHRLPAIRHRGRFDSIARDEWLTKRPLWEIVAIGVSPFTHQRIAKVRIHELRAFIWVDLSDVKEPSENSKRKWARYGKGVAPRNIQEQIQEHCAEAVRDYLNN